MNQGLGLLIFGFFLLWCAAWLAGIVFFRLGKDGVFKQKWHPYFVIGITVGFCLLFLVPLPDLGAPGEPAATAGKEVQASFDQSEIILALVFIPFAVFKAWRTIRTTRFCPKCGTMHRQRLWTSAKFCRRCGTALPKITTMDI